MYKLRVITSLLLVSCANLSCSTHYLQSVFSDRSQRVKIGEFIDEVLKQANSNDILVLIDKFKKTYTDQELYHFLLMNAPDIRSRNFKYRQLKALNHQKIILSEQMKMLLGNSVNVGNCVEIGNPATYIQASSKFLKISGQIYAVGDRQLATDSIQAFSLNPMKGFKYYDKFIYLSDYQPIQPSDIPSSSIELVVCTIGLHHIPVEKLGEFVLSIQRILKPGGTLILREHNCTSESQVALAYAAHSIYNVIATGESVESESKEVRNFQSLGYWIDLLSGYGLVVGKDRLMQSGDPTMNTLLKFTKQAKSYKDAVVEASQILKQSGQEYERPLVKTHLGANEWYNVDVAQEYGEFINHTPFYEFPYFKSIKTYWKIFGNSWQSAAKKSGHLEVLKSDNTMMNLFIGVTMTAEYAAKGVLSIPVRWMFKGEEPASLKAIVYDPDDQLSSLLDKIRLISVDHKFKIKTIEIPRYKEFVKFLVKLANTNIEIKEIAGQSELQFKVRTFQVELDFDAIDGCHREYSWRSISNPDMIITMLTVQLNKIGLVIKQLQSQKVDILYIHDF